MKPYRLEVGDKHYTIRADDDDHAIKQVDSNKSYYLSDPGLTMRILCWSCLSGIGGWNTVHEWR